MQNDIFHQLFRVIFAHDDPYQLKKKYNLPEKLNLLVRLTPDGWFVVTSPELPGLVTQAKSKEELLEMVNDAVLTYFDVPKRKADIVYNQLNFGDETIEYKGQLVTLAA